MFPQLVTTHVAAVPFLIPIYANSRPISTWNGSTHTVIVDDDDDYDYAYGDSFKMNDPSRPITIPKMPPPPSHAPSLATTKTTKQTHDDNNDTHTNKDLPPPYKYDTLQLLFPTTHHTRKSRHMIMNSLCIKYQHILLKRETTTKPMTNIYTDDGPIPPHTRPRSLITSPLLLIHLLPTPRIIRPLLPHLRPFVRKTPDPQTIWNKPIVQYQINADPTLCLRP